MTSVVVNGERYELVPGTSVETLLAEHLPDVVGVAGCRTRGFAVALNDAVVPRSAWSQTAVNAGDWVEIVTAVPGG